MITVAFLELHWKAEQFGNEYLSPILSEISWYMEAIIKDGRIRASDPTILTAALMMTTLVHPEIASLINGGRHIYRNSQDAASAHSAFWLELLSRDPICPKIVSQISMEHES